MATLGTTGGKLPVITDAKSGTSKDMAARQKRYIITMVFRTLCFISMIFVPGPGRWVLLGCAVFLPYIAVVLANQANTRTEKKTRVEHGEPSSKPQLTAGKPADVAEPTSDDIL